MAYLLVGLGGGLGAIIRFLFSKSVGYSINGFPVSTLLINWIGCLLIGICMGVLKDESYMNSYKLLIITGFLGGFTTFSSFGWEVYELMSNDKWKIAISYILLSNLIGVALVFAGYLTILRIKTI